MPRPPNCSAIVLSFFSLQATAASTSAACSCHCTGRLTPEEQTFIPESEYGKVVLRARIYLADLRRRHRRWRSTTRQHAAADVHRPAQLLRRLADGRSTATPSTPGLAENVLDHRLNCRTVYMNPINRYLYWNMNYHVEHHMFPLVPYHALPRLHELVKADMPAALQRPGRSVARDHPRRAAPGARTPPITSSASCPRRPAGPTPQPRRAIFTAEGRPVVDGWVEVCASDLLRREDVHPLRSRPARPTPSTAPPTASSYATDGICTHGNAHLADGLVKGTLIECPKHNGRFDIRDGSPQRPPVCVGAEDLSGARAATASSSSTSLRAGGCGVAQQPTTYSFRVVSNDNVATFIKELVLEPEPARRGLTYQPGDYLQFDIPAYDEIRCCAISTVEPPYADGLGGAARLRLSSPATRCPCRRNYSIASNPARDRQLRFNVRIATPPRGQDCPPASGSSYIFSLKPGDTVTAIGPFGDFHIKPTQTEMVYLGGGAGMAPAARRTSPTCSKRRRPRAASATGMARARGRSSSTRITSRTWPRQHPNFSFHLALSEPLPGGQLDGAHRLHPRGGAREYLRGHPNLRAIEYYLCGPPAMIQATTGCWRTWASARSRSPTTSSDPVPARKGLRALPLSLSTQVGRRVPSPPSDGEHIMKILFGKSIWGMFPCETERFLDRARRRLRRGRR